MIGVAIILALQIFSAFSEQKNVILIIADDFRPNLGVLGESDHFSSPQMKTPSLDKLAERSLVLTNAYTQVALCGPSRSSFLTGRRADTTRCYVTEDKVRESMPDIVTMPQYFKQNGYLALGTGKIFHPGIPNTNKGDDYPASWTEKVFHTPSTDVNHISWHAYTDEELEDLVLRDVANADHFIEKLNEIAPAAITGEQPFFYAMGFHKPHQPWDAPQEFFDLYPEDEIDLPSNPYIPEDMPAAAWSRFTGVLNFDDCSPEGTGIPNLGEANVTYPDSKIRELRRAYYATISFMDRQVGRVLEAVEEAGLSENTVIMFIGDHGLHMGEHSEYDKYTNFEVAHRAPMMLHVPGVTEQAMFTENLVEYVDILPTLVEAAGLPTLDKCPEYSRDVPICREGTSLLRMLDESQSWKEVIFWQQPRGYWTNWTKNYQGYTVRTPQYRYSEYVNLLDDGLETQAPDWTSPEDWGELYDLSVDPMETINLYRQSEWHDIKIMLRKILYAGWSQYND